jgi:hypothetical protein
MIDILKYLMEETQSCRKRNVDVGSVFGTRQSLASPAVKFKEGLPFRGVALATVDLSDQNPRKSFSQNRKRHFYFMTIITHSNFYTFNVLYIVPTMQNTSKDQS